MANQRYFLDIRKSACNQAWLERLTTAQVNIAADIAQSFDVPDILARIIAARGVTRDMAQAHLNPTMRDLMPDPGVVTDLTVAAARIAKAIIDGERVAIFGDYDVDGAASAALLARYLRHFGLAVEIYIPDRIFEGYGPNPAAIEKLAAAHSLIVAVDCGTNSAAALEPAAQSGCDVVVLDHHQVGGALPAIVATVNPNRDDDLSGLGHLCAAAVVFMTLVDVTRQLRGAGSGDLPDLIKMLDLVALATICDVVPLVGLNRAFVKKGLLVARQGGNAGVAALAEVSAIGAPLNPHHFGFMLGPRINAGGRIGDASLGAKLLTMDDSEEAMALAQQLDQLNKERQAIEADMVAEAKADAERELSSSNPPAVLVLANENWHPGIAGLIASRVKDATSRPAFAIAMGKNGVGTGSARSIAGVDIGRLVREAVGEGLLLKGGGHAMAAGVTVNATKLAPLRAFFEQRISEQVNKLIDNQALKIDGALSARGVNTDLLALLDRAGPFGTGNATPVFALPHHRIVDHRIVGNGHVKLRVQANDGGVAEAIAFGAADSPLGALLANGARAGGIHLAGTISANTWQGRTQAQLRVLDAALPVVD